MVLVAIGLCTLAWVGWLTWHEITTLSKSLASIFFGLRTGEVISLGIGMMVVHFLMIGLVFLLSGALFRKRRK